MTTIKRPSADMNVFDRTRTQLENAADGLKEAAKQELQNAQGNVQDAGDHASAAVGHVIASGVRATMATGDVLKGTLDALDAAGHTAKAGGYGAVGVAGWMAEGVASAGRFVAKNVARGFAALANALTDVLKDGKSVTVRELAGDKNAVRFSEKMFGKAAGELNKAGDAMNAAWSSYVSAIDNAAMSGVHVGMAAGHTVGVAGNLVLAAKDLGDAGALKMAELGARVAGHGVQLAENATTEARDAAVLAARISAAAANRLAVAGQGKVTVESDQAFQKQLSAFEQQFSQMQSQSL